MQTNSPEFRTFKKAMDGILKQDPESAIAGLEKEKREREEAKPPKRKRESQRRPSVPVRR
jgi:hypothetical protein